MKKRRPQSIRHGTPIGRSPKPDVIPTQADYQPPRAETGDSFANAEARLGVGHEQDNQFSGGTYDLNPITRNRVLLEYAYRGSWICKAVVEAVADDMTREGIEIESTLDPDKIEAMNGELLDLAIMRSFNELGKWSRLYGGAIGVMLIDGQNLSTPLRMDTIAKGQFKGLCVLDRWMIQPDFSNPVRAYGPDLGKPTFYDMVADYGALPRGRIHYSRVIRLDGVDLPFYQRIAENGWGLSVLEPLWDRLVAFDSATTGAAQLVFKAHLRTLKVKGLKEAIAMSGKALDGVMANVNFIRKYQGFEGLTLLDDTDTFETHQYSFSGLPDVILRLSEQLCGAAGIPMTRLFGQSPGGLGSTGDGEQSQYNDAIKSQQESKMRLGMGKVLEAVHRSLFCVPPEDGFSFNFKPLWQMADDKKSEIASRDADTITKVFDAGIVDRATAMKELKQSSRTTGTWTNISPEQVTEAENEPPAPSEVDGAPEGEESAVDPLGAVRQIAAQ